MPTQVKNISLVTLNKARVLLAVRARIENKANTDLQNILIGLGKKYIRAVISRKQGLLHTKLQHDLNNFLHDIMLVGGLIGFRSGVNEKTKLQLSLLSDDLDVLDTVTKATRDSLENFSRHVDDWVLPISQRLTNEFDVQIDKMLQRGVAKGLSTSSIVDNISSLLPNNSNWSIFREVRGQVNRSYALGREAALEEIKEFIVVEEYITVGDDRVRPEHWARHGTRLPRNDPWWVRNTPPLDSLCRCIKIAHFDSRVKATKRPISIQGVKGLDKFNRPKLVSANDPDAEQIIDLDKELRFGDVGSLKQAWELLKV